MSYYFTEIYADSRKLRCFLAKVKPQATYSSGDESFKLLQVFLAINFIYDDTYEPMEKRSNLDMMNLTSDTGIFSTLSLAQHWSVKRVFH